MTTETRRAGRSLPLAGAGAGVDAGQPAEQVGQLRHLVIVERSAEERAQRVGVVDADALERLARPRRSASPRSPGRRRRSACSRRGRLASSPSSSRVTPDGLSISRAARSIAAQPLVLLAREMHEGLEVVEREPARESTSASSSRRSSVCARIRRAKASSSTACGAQYLTAQGLSSTFIAHTRIHDEGKHA